MTGNSPGLLNAHLRLKLGRASDEQNRQLPAFNTCDKLARTIPQLHMERMLHKRTQIAQFDS